MKTSAIHSSMAAARLAVDKPKPRVQSVSRPEGHTTADADPSLSSLLLPVLQTLSLAVIDAGTRLYLVMFEDFPDDVNQLLVNMLSCAGALSGLLVYLSSISKSRFAYTRSQMGEIEPGLEGVDTPGATAGFENPWITEAIHRDCSRPT